MSSITIKMRDGTVKDFPHVGRGGGSYTKRIEYKGNFVIIIDEYDKQTAIPTDLVQEVIVTEPSRW